MKKIFSKIHLWLAIPLGIIITIICLSGAVLVFRTEMEEATQPELYFVKENSGKKMSIAELIPVVNAQLEKDTVNGITVPSDPGRTYSVSVASNPRASVYIDPYTGKILGKMDMDSFFSKIMYLHRWLLIKRDVGKPIIGYTTLLLVVILISGFIVCFPKTRKQLKRRFTINVRKGWKRFWHDLHVSGGMYALIGLLVLALTGLTWSFQWYREPFYKLFGAEAPRGHGPPQMNTQQQGKNEERRGNGRPDGERKPDGNENQRPERGNEDRRSGRENNDQKPGHRGEERRRGGQGSQEKGQEVINTLHWDQVLADIQNKNPEYKRISIKNNSVTVTQNKTFGNSRASDRYSFNGDTGEITEYTPYEKQEKSNKVRGWIYSIHVGSWGGLFSKIITCLVALIGATLPTTGYYLWIKRSLKKKRRRMV